MRIEKGISERSVLSRVKGHLDQRASQRSAQDRRVASHPIKWVGNRQRDRGQDVQVRRPRTTKTDAGRATRDAHGRGQTAHDGETETTDETDPGHGTGGGETALILDVEKADLGRGQGHHRAGTAGPKTATTSNGEKSGRSDHEGSEAAAVVAVVGLVAGVAMEAVSAKSTSLTGERSARRFASAASTRSGLALRVTSGWRTTPT